MALKVFWFDTETSGVDLAKNGIIQLAGMVEIDGKVVEEIELNADPRKTGLAVESKALEVNGYTLEQLDDFPSELHIYSQLRILFRKYVNPYDKLDKFFAGGYNVKFDVDMLRALWKRCRDDYFGSFFHFGTIDPAHVVPFLMYANVSPVLEPGKMRLTDIAGQLGVLEEGAHDAMVDIRMTRNVTLALYDLAHIPITH